MLPFFSSGMIMYFICHCVAIFLKCSQTLLCGTISSPKMTESYYESLALSLGRSSTSLYNLNQSAFINLQSASGLFTFLSFRMSNLVSPFHDLIHSEFVSFSWNFHLSLLPSYWPFSFFIKPITMTHLHIVSINILQCH